jgi:hypothetical protein
MAVRKQLEKACNGDLAALQFLAERMEGKPKQVIVGDGEEDPIALMVSRGEEARTRVLEQLSRIGSQVVSGIIEDTNASDEDKSSSGNY